MTEWPLPAWRGLLGRLLLAAVLAIPFAACGDERPPAEATARSGGRATIAAAPRWSATHLLIRWRGALKAPAAVKRSKEEARALAESLRLEAVSGRDFADLVQTYTEARDPKGAPEAEGGKPGSVTFGEGTRVPGPEFEAAVRNTPVGALVPTIVETPWGFHVIRRDA